MFEIDENTLPLTQDRSLMMHMLLDVKTLLPLTFHWGPHPAPDLVSVSLCEQTLFDPPGYYREQECVFSELA